MAQPHRRIPVIGHAEACRDRYAELHAQVLTAAEQTGQPEWQKLVRRFRSLRATLVSHTDFSFFAAQAYLLSTDVSLCAADHAETLKALQALVQDLFPELIRSAVHGEIWTGSVERPRPMESGAERGYPSSSGNTSRPSSTAGFVDTEDDKDWGRSRLLGAATTPHSEPEPNSRLQSSSRGMPSFTHPQAANATLSADLSVLEDLWAECIGLLILYFTCIPRGRQGLEVTSICRLLPRHVLHTAPVKQALSAYGALTRGDIGFFLHEYRIAGWRQQRLFQVKLVQVREYGLEVLSSSYRQLQCIHANTMLGLPPYDASDQLFPLLQALQTRGRKSVTTALANFTPGDVLLKFRS